jgi:small subunit ribosomal protein S16
MAVKMRLSRHGRKKFAFYHIVVANSRAPRDGRYIERIGTYNPNTNPATIDLEFDKALDWLEKGAQPTDTVRAILSYKGVLLKKHLQGGIKKGALTEEDAELKFETWMNEKSSKIQDKKDRLSKEADTAQKKLLAAETKANEARAAAQAARNAALAKEAAAKVAQAASAGEAEAETSAPEGES